MANGTYKLLKQDASGNWNEVDILAENGKVLGFDSSLNPIMVSSNVDIFFYPTYISNTSGAYTCYNEEFRNYYLLNFNVTGSTMVVSIVDYGYNSGTQPSNNIEHYCLIKNVSSVTKTVAIQGIGSGKKFVNEGLTSVSLDVNQSFEFSYVWLTRGSERICIVTKSNLLTEVTI